MLHELGDGESGTDGTSFGKGEATLAEFLQECLDGEDAAKVKAGRVPQTVFWVMDDADRLVGMVRIRHRLSERLLLAGGHIGYYIRRSERRRGHGKRALRLALDRLPGLGIHRALVTIDPDNEPSIRVALANGGVADTPSVHPDTGRPMNRYWIGVPSS